MAARRTSLLLGSQTPTHRLAPAFDYTRGVEAIELADMVGLRLDRWQKDILRDGCGVVSVPSPHHRDHRLVDQWSAFEIEIELSRQNGKSVVFEARSLAGLYLFRERLIVYSAHKGETVMEAFNRIEELIYGNSELKAEVKRVSRTNGKEGIELWTGQKMKFRTRTTGGGRGLAGDCVILDEDQDLDDEQDSALRPIVSARPNPQLWFGGSAGTKKSTVKGRLIRRAEKGSPRLVCYRWAGGEDDDLSSPRTWAKLNPAQGRRIAQATIESEYDAMSTDMFGRERCGVGDYPREEGEEWVIPRRRWEDGGDEASTMVGPVVFSIEVAWSRGSASIGVAGWRPDRHRHLEVVANEVGTLWTVQELKRLTSRHPTLGVVLDPGSPANSLIGPLRDAGVDVTLLKSTDLTQGFGSFYDGFMAEERTYHHTGGTLLTSALSQASTRTVSGSTTWRRQGSFDVSPLLAVTWAAHGLTMLDKPKPPPPSPMPVRRTTTRDPRASTADLTTASF